MDSIFGSGHPEQNTEALLKRLEELEHQLDIAERSVENLSMALDATAAGTWDWNIQTGELTVNARWAEIIGYEPEEISPLTIEFWQQHCHPEDLVLSDKLLREHFEGKTGHYETELRMRHKDGHWIRVFNRGKLVSRDENSAPLHMIVASREIVANNHAEPCTSNPMPADRNASEFKSLIDNIPGAVYRINSSGATMLSMYPEFLPEFSQQEFEHDLLETLAMVHPDDRQAIIESNLSLRSSRKSEMLTYRIHTGKNEIRWIEDRKTSIFSPEGVFTGIDGILFDITARVKAQEEKHLLESRLLKSQRLETIGTLAGGIAHDFNNILTPILGYAEMGVMSLTEDDPLHDFFSEIMQAAERAQSLVSQILTFSRAQDSTPSPICMQTIVTEALKLLGPSIPPYITIEQHIEKSCRNILADPSQIHQVIINLCTNAFQAMEGSAGTLKIGLDEIIPDDTMLKGMPKLRQRSYVHLCISDTGTGMDDATMERIFEPFFTTKSVDKGTGLGLSVVHGIIVSCNGEITVESIPGKGSTFNIYLPVIEEKNTAASDEDNALQGSGNILFIDDEQTAVEMMTLMLTKLGFTIQTEKSPSTALELFREAPERFDLVITDLGMPEMNGLQLSEELWKITPGLPVIFMTGNGQNIDISIPLEQLAISRLLKKPVKLAQLASTVNELLITNNNSSPALS